METPRCKCRKKMRWWGKLGVYMCDDCAYFEQPEFPPLNKGLMNAIIDVLK